MKTVGSSVDLGFDSSKGPALGQTKFTITKICDQNVNIVLTSFYDVNQKKIYTCRVNLNGSTMTLVTGNDLEPVNIVEVECFAIMGYLTNRVGPAGLAGPPGRGILLDDHGNLDFAGKRLTEVGEPQDDDDAVTKTFLDDQFMPAPMTRRVLSKGISMQGGRIEGLPDPLSEFDAARKKYVDDRDEVKAAEVSEDQKLTQKIEEGDKFKSIHTKNMLDLKSGNITTGAAQYNVFVLGEERDYTQKYHNSKTHIVCSLHRNTGLISVDIGGLKPGKYGLRVEGIIDPKDDGSRFDIDVRTSLLLI